MVARRIRSVEDARAVLREIQAPERLVVHGLLVTEAADALLDALKKRAITVDAELVRAGAMLHDAGKTLFADELREAGSRHEEAGQALLLEHDVDPAVGDAAYRTRSGPRCRARSRSCSSRWPTSSGRACAAPTSSSR